MCVWSVEERVLSWIASGLLGRLVPTEDGVDDEQKMKRQQEMKHRMAENGRPPVSQHLDWFVDARLLMF